MPSDRVATTSESAATPPAASKKPRKPHSRASIEKGRLTRLRNQQMRVMRNGSLRSPSVTSSHYVDPDFDEGF